MAYTKVVRGTFTPALDFSGGVTGITYSGRSGIYTQIGNIVTFTLSLELSNKGSSVGTAQITGIPVVPSNTTIYPVSADSLTYSGQLNARMGGTSSTIFIDAFATTGSRTSLADTAFANSTFIQISGSFLI